MPDQPNQTIALETYARRSYNYFDRMVDADGLPYFNIFWTEPAEAAHDWPDFGDVMSRALQGAIMGRHMTGEKAEIEETWQRKVLSYLGPDDGLLYRPATTFSQHVADAGDQMLTLYALVTAYADNGDPALRAAVMRMVDGMIARADAGEPGMRFLDGFSIKGLMAAARYADYEPALALAGRSVRHIFVDAPLFSPDNTFRHGGHMHGNLRCLVGSADYALATHDPVLFSRVDALYRWVRGTATRFGFLPEAIGRKADVVLCETCALMDYLGLAVTLANHGHPEYWGDIERVVRNQLIENQLVDASWLASDPTGRPDTHQFTWRDVGERMVGGYAGWSSPTHILAVRETLGAHWGGDELHGKTRAFQNCCGGSGTHAFFIAWKNAARYDAGRLDVHMHIDKLLPQAEIRGYQPYQGLLTIKLTAPAEIKVRIPEWVSPDEMRVEASSGLISGKAWGNYLHLGAHAAGEQLRISYPLAEYAEEESIGNPGWRQYRYRAAWRGDTVMEMIPLGNDYETGWSDYDNRDVPVFYGEAGPGRLYQRQAMLTGGEPEFAKLHVDDGGLDFWHGLA
jgi:hypothetical protein